MPTVRRLNHKLPSRPHGFNQCRGVLQPQSMVDIHGARSVAYPFSLISMLRGTVPRFDSILNFEFKPRQGAWHVRLHECNYRDFPRDFLRNGSRDTPSVSIPFSKSKVQQMRYTFTLYSIKVGCFVCCCESSRES